MSHLSRPLEGTVHVFCSLYPPQLLTGGLACLWALNRYLILKALQCAREVGRWKGPGRALFPECWITARLASGPSGPASWCERLRSWGHACPPLVTPYSFWDSSAPRLVFDFCLLTSDWYSGVLRNCCQGSRQCKNPATPSSWGISGLLLATCLSHTFYFSASQYKK